MRMRKIFHLADYFLWHWHDVTESTTPTQAEKDKFLRNGRLGHGSPS